MGDVVVLDLAHFARLVAQRPLAMHRVGHGAEAGDLAHQFVRERHQMAGEVAQRAEAGILARQPPRPGQRRIGHVVLIDAAAEIENLADGAFVDQPLGMSAAPGCADSRSPAP